MHKIVKFFEIIMRINRLPFLCVTITSLVVECFGILQIQFYWKDYSDVSVELCENIAISHSVSLDKNVKSY